MKSKNKAGRDIAGGSIKKTTFSPQNTNVGNRTMSANISWGLAGAAGATALIGGTLQALGYDVMSFVLK